MLESGVWLTHSGGIRLTWTNINNLDRADAMYVSIYCMVGMALSVNSDNKHIMLTHMLASTPVHKLLRWKTTLRNSIVVGIDGNGAYSCSFSEFERFGIECRLC